MSVPLLIVCMGVVDVFFFLFNMQATPGVPFYTGEIAGKC